MTVALMRQCLLAVLRKRAQDGVCKIFNTMLDGGNPGFAGSA